MSIRLANKCVGAVRGYSGWKRQHWDSILQYNQVKHTTTLDQYSSPIKLGTSADITSGSSNRGASDVGNLQTSDDIIKKCQAILWVWSGKSN
jgi:hypothetical protein